MTIASTDVKVAGHAGFLAALPGIGAALLPVKACAVCWPIYVGVLSSLGLGFLLEAEYLAPVTIVFLGIALLTLAWRAPRRRGYGPFTLGLFASGAIIAFKFAFPIDMAAGLGLAGLVAATIWNAWPKFNPQPTVACEACVSQTSGPQTPNARTGE